LSPDVRQMFVLAVPGVLAAGIGQINLLVGTSIATGQQGAAAWLYYADRLYQLPMGVVGVALSVALLPNLSRLLAAGDTTGARASQTLAVLAAMALTLPASVGLYVLAQPVIALLFERGAFSAADTQATALAIKAFCFGLPAFVLIKALQPSFFARRDTRAPLIDGAIGVAVNIGFSLSLFPVYGHVAIALATSLAGWVTLGLMLVRLARRGIWRVNWRLAQQLAAQLVAALVMGLALNGLMALAVRHGLVINNGTGQIFYVAALVLAGAAIFFALARLLGGVQLSDVESLRKGA
ncbi:MAG: lipid II flippase MurJ, partial [Rhodobiaceae bacterium]